MSLLSDYMEKYNESVKIKGINENEVISISESVTENSLTVIQEATIKIDNKQKPNMIITVNADGLHNRNYYKNPYFKLYKGKSITEAKQMSRISLMSPTYQPHNEGPDEWILRSGEKDRLIEFLKSPTALHIPGNRTVWDDIKHFAVIISGSSMGSTMTEKDKQFILSLDMPNYRLLEK